MSFQSIHFPRQAYPSLQVGDRAYRIASTTDNFSNSGFTVGGFGLDIGEVTNIQDGTITQDGVTTLTTLITIDVVPGVTETTTNHFIYFVKNEQVEVGDVLGYYGKALFLNNSTTRAELYSAACEFSESSK
jgi:hypothetical protein